jgi:HlyD family secretion protein
MKIAKKILFILCVLVMGAGGYYYYYDYMKNTTTLFTDVPTVQIFKRDFEVAVKTVGELEAARSISIASTIKGDQAKIIDIIADGINVKSGQVLVSLDPTPFEEKIEKIKMQIKEQEAFITTQEQTYEWEKEQAEHEKKTAAFDVEAAELELEKVVHGDGPAEISRLKGAMQKAFLKYEELKGYSNDLIELQEKGFLNPTELKQAQKKLVEEEEAYDVAKLQYDSYVNHVNPMLIKKAEANLKRSITKQEEAAKTGNYKVVKAWAVLLQAKQLLKDLNYQLHESEKELAQTYIRAPGPGMVVHREEYRNSQKRKPRVGDILVKNQPLLDLPDLSSMVIKTRVREVDLYKIALGKKATLEVDAYPQMTFNGTVSLIGVLALADFGSTAEKYFEVRITLDDVDNRLRPGMTTRATIHAHKAENVLAVPVHAVFEEQKDSYCYVAGAFGYEKKKVQLGMCNEQWMEIKEGLNEGEFVCLLNPKEQD